MSERVAVICTTLESNEVVQEEAQDRMLSVESCETFGVILQDQSEMLTFSAEQWRGDKQCQGFAEIEVGTFAVLPVMQREPISLPMTAI